MTTLADSADICPRCHHHRLLHCGEDHCCEVRQMKAGFENFAAMPRCACTYYAELIHWTYEAYQKHVGCSCTVSDAWKCGRLLRVSGKQMACSCKCHGYAVAPPLETEQETEKQEGKQ